MGGRKGRALGLKKNLQLFFFHGRLPRRRLCFAGSRLPAVLSNSSLSCCGHTEALQEVPGHRRSATSCTKASWQQEWARAWPGRQAGGETGKNTKRKTVCAPTSPAADQSFFSSPFIFLVDFSMLLSFLSRVWLIFPSQGRDGPPMSAAACRQTDCNI